MRATRAITTTAIACTTFALTIGPAGPAEATPQIGSCTSSYQLISNDDLIASDPTAADVIGLIDTNKNGFVCFKLYPNGDHHGHDGNLVDDKSGPKS